MIKTYFCDWRNRFVAYDDDDEPNDNGYQPYGDGETEQEAIEDFKRIIEERSNQCLTAILHSVRYGY